MFQKITLIEFMQKSENGSTSLLFVNEQGCRYCELAETEIKKEDINFKIKKRIEENYVIKDIYFEDNGKNFHYFEKVKLSTLEQIKALAESCGFEVVKIWGNYNLENFDRETSPRCIFEFRI